MLLPTIPLLLATTAAFNLPAPQHIFSNPPPSDTITAFPSIHESAVLARRILRLTNIGTLSTVFPTPKDSSSSSSSSSDAAHPLERRPATVAGAPIGLMDYVADCERSSPSNPGSPTILAISIATSFKNVADGSNITLSLRWHPPSTPSRDPKTYSPAALPRFSLLGHLEEIPAAEVWRELVPACFVRAHPDAAAWLPGNPIHASHWVRLVVDEIYWVGGFGNVARIGWLPVEEWRSVTEEEIEAARLPGEEEEKKGWFEWLDL